MNQYRIGIPIVMILSSILLPDRLGADENATAPGARDRTELLSGEAAAAAEWNEVDTTDAQNPTGEYNRARVEQERARTRTRMLAEVDQAWQRPETPAAQAEAGRAVADVSPLWRKLNEIVVADVSFAGMEL